MYGVIEDTETATDYFWPGQDSRGVEKECMRTILQEGQDIELSVEEVELLRYKNGSDAPRPDFQGFSYIVLYLVLSCNLLLTRQRTVAHDELLLSLAAEYLLISV